MLAILQFVRVRNGKLVLVSLNRWHFERISVVIHIIMIKAFNSITFLPRTKLFFYIRNTNLKLLLILTQKNKYEKMLSLFCSPYYRTYFFSRRFCPGHFDKR